MDPISLICIFPSLSSTRHFGNSLASDSIETPKLSENKTVRAWSGPKVDNIVLRNNVKVRVYEWIYATKLDA
ncbi:hypothetical protein DVH24_020156 [Malus domestica]|uniref:Uncharacterized protein n=1 Tax=Malus domestica TaxID=3750 RepID=A0A498JBE1_MALDO|nr:hypothetical protein DVH24_020156 [Malus domestica]